MVVGSEAGEAIQWLVRNDLKIPRTFHLEFILHDVGVNWRQRNVASRQKVEALDESLLHGSIESFLVRVGDHADVARLFGIAQRRGLALSIASRVLDGGRRFVGHIALMNLHPEGFLSRRELEDAIMRVTGNIPGYVLGSGRYFHYYGAKLLTQDEWIDFLAQFLMPCTMVSQRYIGHSLIRGFCCLRLNSSTPHKPTVPSVLSTLPSTRHRE